MPIAYDIQQDAFFLQGKAEGIAEGKAEGIAEGKAEGIAEGKAEGIAKGKAEGIAEKQDGLIRAMLADGTLSVEQIARIAQVSVEYVRGLA